MKKEEGQLMEVTTFSTSIRTSVITFGSTKYFRRLPSLFPRCSPLAQFFHADDGRGLGASHQTGWQATIFVSPKNDAYRFYFRSGLVAYHILQSGATCRLSKTPRSMFFPSDDVRL
jgi:hypothetical protein